MLYYCHRKKQEIFTDGYRNSIIRILQWISAYLYQENLYQAYYNTPAEKHVVSESLEQEAMPVLVHRLAAQLGYTESEAEVEKEFLCEM